jgi:hypothetical protein
VQTKGTWFWLRGRGSKDCGYAAVAARVRGSKALFSRDPTCLLHPNACELTGLQRCGLRLKATADTTTEWWPNPPQYEFNSNQGWRPPSLPALPEHRHGGEVRQVHAMRKCAERKEETTSGALDPDCRCCFCAPCPSPPRPAYALSTACQPLVTPPCFAYTRRRTDKRCTPHASSLRCLGRYIFHAVGSWNKWNAMVGMLIQCHIPLPALVAEVDAAGWLQSPSRAAVDLSGGGGGGGGDRAGGVGGDGRCREKEERAET